MTKIYLPMHPRKPISVPKSASQELREAEKFLGTDLLKILFDCRVIDKCRVRKILISGLEGLVALAEKF
jgi:hypothetical protein